MKAILAIPTAALLAWAGTSAVHAHDWYPAECCSGSDCIRAGAIVADGPGKMTVLVGDLRIGIPVALKARRSPDTAIHVCYQSFPGEFDGQPIFVPSCLFLPAHLM